MNGQPDVIVRRLIPEDASAYRALMLDAFATHPDAFTSSAAEREALPLAWWAQRLVPAPPPAEAVFGAFVGAVLAGAVGLTFEPREKARHKGRVTGMIVADVWRGRGIGEKLLAQLIDHAATLPGLRLLQLTVTQGNLPAQRLYAKAGFQAFGVEPFAVAVGDGFVAKVHMWRPLDARLTEELEPT